MNWRQFVDSPETRSTIIHQGAMFISTPALSEPLDDKNPDKLITRYDGLVFDFDDEKNPEKALTDMRALIQHLSEIYSLDTYCIRLYCSGKKGFHVEIPTECFRSQNGDAYLPRIYKRMVCQWVESLGLTTLDTSMYCMGQGKPFRIANVRRKNGRYKVPLTFDEVQSLPIEDLWKFSDAPREVEAVDADTDCPDLAAFFLRHKEAVHKEVQEERDRPPADPELIKRLNGQLAPCIVHILLKNPKTAKSKFNTLVMNLVKYFQTTGFDLNSALNASGKFLRDYLHSTVYTTPEARLKHFRTQWRYHEGHAGQFSCSFILGLGFKGSAFDCKKCKATSESDTRKNKGAAYTTMYDILQKDYPEPIYLINKMLPRGHICLFAGKPKSGKTLMSEGIGISFSNGGKVFGSIDVEEGTVLMLALEDTPRRLKNNIQKMLPPGHNANALQKLIVCFSIKKFQAGGEEELDALMTKHRPTMVIVDTLKKIRADVKNGNKTLYDVDYEAVDAFRPFAEKFNSTFIIITHLRKMEAEDPFDCLSGSLGLTGAADSMWVLQRRHGGMVLFGRGRDMEDFQKAAKLDPVTLTWQILGDADEVQSTSQQQAVYDVLKSSDVPLKPKSIHALVSDLSYDSVRQLLRKLLSANRIEVDARGMYTAQSPFKNNNENFQYKEEKNHSQRSQYSQESQHSQRSQSDFVRGTQEHSQDRSQNSVNNINELRCSVSGVSGVNGVCEKGYYEVII